MVRSSCEPGVDLVGVEHRQSPGRQPCRDRDRGECARLGLDVCAQAIVDVVVDVQRHVDAVGGDECLDVDLQQPPVAQERDLRAAQARELLIDVAPPSQLVGEERAGLILVEILAGLQPAKRAVEGPAVGVVDDPEVRLAQRVAARGTEVGDLVAGHRRESALLRACSVGVRSQGVLACRDEAGAPVVKRGRRHARERPFAVEQLVLCSVASGLVLDEDHARRRHLAAHIDELLPG